MSEISDSELKSGKKKVGVPPAIGDLALYHTPLTLALALALAHHIQTLVRLLICHTSVVDMIKWVWHVPHAWMPLGDHWWSSSHLIN